MMYREADLEPPPSVPVPIPKSPPSQFGPQSRPLSRRLPHGLSPAECGASGCRRNRAKARTMRRRKPVTTMTVHASRSQLVAAVKRRVRRDEGAEGKGRSTGGAIPPSPRIPSPAASPMPVLTATSTLNILICELSPPSLQLCIPLSHQRYLLL
jgi:hypothetical protein